MNRFFRTLQPDLYQGEGQLAPYFEGWYYKIESRDGRIFAFIPGISRSRETPHCFLQLFGFGGPSYLSYPTVAFAADPDRLRIRIGEQYFDESELDVHTDTVQAHIRFTQPVPFSGRKYTLGMMGPFALVPFLECHHSVITVQSPLEGRVITPEGILDFDGGLGYIEKDWGSRFPKPYLWTHAFLQGGGSFMLSAAKVPVLGAQIGGIAAFLYDGRQLRRFTTYNGACLKTLTRSEDGNLLLHIQLRNGTLQLSLREGAAETLRAPENAGMTRNIRESAGGSLRITLRAQSGRTIFSDTALNASIEICGDIGNLLH